jgi:acyl-CoA synthetase (AMP-forming)/AMP-acid ligase II
VTKLIAGSPDRINIASSLRSTALRQPHRMAVVVPEGRNRQGRARYSHMTYRQLDDDSDRIALGLAGYGVEPAARAAVLVKPGLDFFALVFGLFKAGVVPVLIDPGMGLLSLGRCLEEAVPEVFMGVSKALWARRVLGWGSRSVRRVIHVGQSRSWMGFTTLDDLRRLGQRAMGERRSGDSTIQSIGPDDTAAILFTSGSTGPPKGAVYTHSIFQAQIEIFRALYEIEPGEVDLCTFPLFALFAPALGMTAIVPDMDPTRPAQVDPMKLFETIDDFGPTNLFGSPALLRRVASAGAKLGKTIPTLRRVVTAGAPSSARVLAGFARLLEPPAEIFTPYGATEALPVASIGSNEILSETRPRTDQGAGVCVGRPVPGLDARVIEIRDEPIPTWSPSLELPVETIGEIVVSGPVVTREYFRRPDATALAKIADPARGSFYHRMGDLGYFDDRGRIWFCGRKTHRVTLADTTLFTVCCEGIFNTHPEAARTALVGVRRPRGTIPVLCVEPVRRLTATEAERVRRELLEIGSARTQTKPIRDILFHPSFPVDIRHNSKIFREKLAVWAARKLT